jgi:hypothetical protein
MAFVLILTAAGCAKDIHLQLDNKTPLYVIEGRISNLEGPYFVRVTKTTNQLSSDFNDNGAVTGALVILSDDAGTRDTLIPLDLSRINRYWYIHHDGILDSIAEKFESNFYTRERGYYQTTHIKGEPGHTYHLEVQIGQEAFHADAYMPYVPLLDSAALNETAVLPEGTKGWLPFVYFKEPTNEKNYYLLQFNSPAGLRYDIAEKNGYLGVSYFPFYVVDDKILPAYVNGLPVRVTLSGHSTYSGTNYFSLSPNSQYQVRLSSLTKEAYEYFRVLISQFEDDGNAYKPVPASAAGNISGGALGLFYATHVSYKLIIP